MPFKNRETAKPGRLAESRVSAPYFPTGPSCPAPLSRPPGAHRRGDAICVTYRE